MRTYITLREIINAHKDLRERIEDLEKKYDQQFQVVFKAIKMLLEHKSEDDNNGGKRF